MLTESRELTLMGAVPTIAERQRGKLEGPSQSALRQSGQQVTGGQKIWQPYSKATLSRL